MAIDLLDLPNEILEIIAFHVIGGVWKDDVCDFLSFTSTCRRLNNLSHDKRYWQTMVARRDPTLKKPSESITWFEYCKQIYLMRTISSNELENNISRYDENYFCTIEKILLWPNKIRIYIDERGDNSEGSIQDPRSTKIAFVQANDSHFQTRNMISICDSQFSIEDEESQYLGYLDFSINISLDHIGKLLTFEYGVSFYSAITLFHIEQTFIDKYNLLPLMRQSQNIK